MANTISPNSTPPLNLSNTGLQQKELSLFERLPLEIHELIFSHLYQQDLKEILLTSKTMRVSAINTGNCNKLSTSKKFIGFLAENLDGEKKKKILEISKKLDTNRLILIPKLVLCSSSLTYMCRLPFVDYAKNHPPLLRPPRPQSIHPSQYTENFADLAHLEKHLLNIRDELITELKELDKKQIIDLTFKFTTKEERLPYLFGDALGLANPEAAAKACGMLFNRRELWVPSIIEYHNKKLLLESASLGFLAKGNHFSSAGAALCMSNIFGRTTTREIFPKIAEAFLQQGLNDAISRTKMSWTYTDSPFLNAQGPHRPLQEAIVEVLLSKGEIDEAIQATLSISNTHDKIKMFLEILKYMADAVE